MRTSKNEVLLLIRLEMVTKPSQKSLDSTNPQSTNPHFNTTATFPKSGDKHYSKIKMCNSLWGHKGKGVTSKQLKASLLLANVMFMSPPSWEHWTTRWKGERTRRKSLLSTKNIATCLKFAKGHVHKPEKYRKKCFVDGWDKNRAFWFKWAALCLKKGKHCIPT